MHECERSSVSNWYFLIKIYNNIFYLIVPMVVSLLKCILQLGQYKQGQKRLRWFRCVVRRAKKVEINVALQLKIEGKRKRQAMKQWTDVVEDMQSGKVQEDTRDWKGWIMRVVKGMANTC